MREKLMLALMKRKGGSGFTLVELMIVVAIIGILAAIAIPNFVSMQYRSKRAELPMNVDAIKVAEIAYEAAYDEWVNEQSYVPDDSPAKKQRPWTFGNGFETLGWVPDGHVRGSYKVTSTSKSDILVTGITDVDGDGDVARYTASKSVNPAMATKNDTY